MLVREIRAKSALTKSNIPGADFCINPYVGCTHGCRYCYARFMAKYVDHGEPWGEFVDVKVNAAEVLRRQLERSRETGGSVLIGTVTDAYQPLERELGLTRAVLGTLSGEGFDVSILTKSDLVVRDVDVLRELGNCAVDLTITSLDDDVRAALEPGAPSPARRLEALRVLHDNGVRTYVSVAPALPTFTNLRAIFEAVRGFADGVRGESLNVRAVDWGRLEAALRRHFPGRGAALKKAATSPDYWDGVEAEFERLCAEFEVPSIGFYRH
jgi:DNA repair photolyase